MHRASREAAWATLVTLAMLPWASASSATAPQTPTSAPFAVAAVVRGTLVPVARFTGLEWVNSWPEPDESKTPAPALDDIPTAWLGRPVSREWTVTTSDGRQTHVHVVGTTRADTGCTTQVQLTIDGDQALEGVAVDTGQLVAPVPALQRGSPEWQRLEPEVNAACRANQRRLVEERVQEDSRS